MIPDCAACGAAVVLDTDHDGPVEVCTNPECGIAQSPGPVLNGIRGAVREVKRKRPLLAPKCFGRLHHQCRVSNCGCYCHKKGDRRGAQA